MIKIVEKVTPKTFQDFVRHYGEKEALQQILGGYSEEADVLYDIKNNLIRYDGYGLLITKQVLADAVKYVKKNPTRFKFE